MVEIALGVNDNTKSLIKYPSQVKNLFETFTEKLLHCNEFRTFWVKWADNYVSVGRGPVVGEQRFMDVKESGTSGITSIGLASGMGNAAVWRVRENNGESST